jgi:hypothetical protein
VALWGQNRKVGRGTFHLQAGAADLSDDHEDHLMLEFNFLLMAREVVLILLIKPLLSVNGALVTISTKYFTAAPQISPVKRGLMHCLWQTSLLIKELRNLFGIP